MTLPADPLAAAPPALALLRPLDRVGAFYLLFGLTLTGLALLLSLSGFVWLWLVGQVLLSFALLFWFAALHEAGHKTLFRTRWLNTLTGHLAGFLALIPFDCWKPVHAKHHRWTGWQDLDLTTQTLVPRPLRLFEKVILNACWWLWLPLLAVLYRVNNYWNLPRLRRAFPVPAQRRAITRGILLYGLAYILLSVLIGPMQILWLIGLALFLTLNMQDLLILSQHTHIPMQLSGGRPVPPFAPVEQEVFTRSLAFPRWFARLFLLNLDAHELHHMYPAVPGCWLHLLPYQPHNLTPWWLWTWRAKRLRADVLLFQNRDNTGYAL